MGNTIELDSSNLPPAMAAYKKREDVAEIIYDWIHESQITHRKTYEQCSAEQKQQYRVIAARIIERASQP